MSTMFIQNCQIILFTLIVPGKKGKASLDMVQLQKHPVISSKEKDPTRRHPLLEKIVRPVHREFTLVQRPREKSGRLAFDFMKSPVRGSAKSTSACRGSRHAADPDLRALLAIYEFFS